MPLVVVLLAVAITRGFALLGSPWMIDTSHMVQVPIAGSLAAKRATAITAGTLPTHTPLFVTLLVITVLLVGALTFLPALALGPIVEHLQLYGSH